MAKRTKFEDMIKKADAERQSSSAQNTVKKEVKRQFKKEQQRLNKLKNQKTISSLINAEDENQNDTSLEEYKNKTTQQNSKIMQPTESNFAEDRTQTSEEKSNNSTDYNGLKQQPTDSSSSEVKNIEKADLDEIKRLQAEILQERGGPIEIDTHYKKDKDEDEEPSQDTFNQTDEQVASEGETTSQTDNEKTELTSENKESGENDNFANEIKNENGFDNQEFINSNHSNENLQDNANSELHYREKDEIDEKLKSNSNISRINDNEIAKMKRQIAIEKGIISVDDAAEENEKNANLTKNNEKNASKTSNYEENIVKPEESTLTNIEQNIDENQETIVDDGFYKPTKKKKNILKQDDGPAPPDEAKQDNITEEQIEQLLKQQELQELQEELEKEEESYEGMTEEEIAEAKERKRKFAELKLRYNSKETDDNGDAGDYRKNLDFSINTSIKRVNLKPPKKPFIISAIVVFVLLVVGAVVTYFLMNQPPTPVTLQAIKLSQSYVSQYVGEELDLRGIDIICSYSDGSNKKISVTRDLISKTSNNINSTDYIIDHYSDDTYVIFSYEGFSDRLNISLTEITLESIVVEIYPKNLDAGQTLKFENILLIANAKEVEGNVETENTFTIKLDSSLLSATIDDTPLERNEEGFVIPSGLLGGKTIKFTYNSGVREYTAIIQVNISRQN